MCGCRVCGRGGDTHTQHRQIEFTGRKMSTMVEGEEKFNLLINVIKLTRKKKHRRRQREYGNFSITRNSALSFFAVLKIRHDG